MLAYYRNTITHIFYNDSLIAMALASFGREQGARGVEAGLVGQRALWLSALLEGEYVVRTPLS